MDELPPGSVKIVRAGELALGVYHVNGEFYAIEDRCSHDDGPLCEGDWDPDERVVVCPRHGSDIRPAKRRAPVPPCLRAGRDLSRPRRGRDRQGRRVKRCWESSTIRVQRYHDEEWGRPVTDEAGVLERLCLEGFQSGLSWLTILRKRENFRAAFAGFDPDAVARFGDRDVERLLADAGIVRHRGKIEAAIANARATVELREATPLRGARLVVPHRRAAQRPNGSRRRRSRSSSRSGCGRRASGSSAPRPCMRRCRRSAS